MSERRKVNRDDQRRARALMRQRGISYMQALELVPHTRGRTEDAAEPASAVTGWLKSIHFRHEDWTIQPGEETWISDISRHDRNGNRVYRQDGTEWGEPSWKVGDQVGLYFGGTLRVPVLVEVIAPPRFDEEFVQRYNDGGEPDAGERWPWVTDVRGVARLPLAQAPTLDDIRVEHVSMRRRSRKLLTADQLHRLEQALR